LADTKVAGKLSKQEFRIAMHLVYHALKNNDVPVSLSQELLNQAFEIVRKYLSLLFIYLFIYLFVCLFVYLFIYFLIENNDVPFFVIRVVNQAFE
jgi:hypothetical protein